MNGESFKQPQKNELAREDEIIIENLASQLENPVRHIINQLKPRIDRGEYKIIIGDDASGRLPTLVLHNILSSIYKSRGFPKLQTRFIAGAHGNPWYKDFLQRKKNDRIREYIKNLKTFLDEGALPGRILIVSEFIEKGEGLSPLATLLNEAGIEYDIATVGVASKTVQQELEKQWGHEIIPGEITVSSYIHNMNKYTGVIKDNPNLHARKLRPGDKSYSGPGNEVEKIIFDENTSLRVSETRKHLGELARRLSDEYSQQKPPSE